MALSTKKQRLSLAATPRLAALVACLLSFSGPRAHAADFCVQAGDAPALQAALAQAAGDGEDDVIRLQAGDYDLPANFSLFYYPNTEQHHLALSGGFYPEGVDPCALRLAPFDARATVIHGGAIGLFLPEGVGNIEVDSITFRDGVSTNQVPIPIIFSGAGGSVGAIHIKNSMFLANVSLSSAAVFVGALDGNVFIENSVFADNASTGGASPIQIGTSNTNGVCLEILGSTFARNTSTAAGVRIDSQNCTAAITNSILWETPSSTASVDLVSPATSLQRNDDVFNVADTTGAQVIGLISRDPLFNQDLSLSDYSPLRDAGDDYNGVDTDFDVTGAQRRYGAHVDIGAIEMLDVIFAHDFDVDYGP